MHLNPYKATGFCLYDPPFMGGLGNRPALWGQKRTRKAISNEVVVVNRNLTEKQERFIDYYIELGNATEAARRAGYSQRTAKQIGNENLTKLDFFIQERLKELEDARIADATEVMKHLTAAMRGEVDEEVVVVESIGDYESRARIVKKQVSARERIRAAELLGKRYALFTDKLDVEGSVDTGLHKLNSILDQLKD